MSYRKYLMPSDITPSAAYAATAVDSDTDTISRAKAIDIVVPYDDNRVMRDALEELPPVQPEIIRCKDCKYYDPEEKECLDLLGHGRRWEEYDFCSYADRLQEGGENVLGNLRQAEEGILPP